MEVPFEKQGAQMCVRHDAPVTRVSRTCTSDPGSVTSQKQLASRNFDENRAESTLLLRKSRKEIMPPTHQRSHLSPQTWHEPCDGPVGSVEIDKCRMKGLHGEQIAEYPDAQQSLKYRTCSLK